MPCIKAAVPVGLPLRQAFLWENTTFGAKVWRWFQNNLWTHTFSIYRRLRWSSYHPCKNYHCVYPTVSPFRNFHLPSWEKNTKSPSISTGGAGRAHGRVIGYPTAVCNVWSCAIDRHLGCSANSSKNQKYQVILGGFLHKMTCFFVTTKRLIFWIGTPAGRSRFLVGTPQTKKLQMNPPYDRSRRFKKSLVRK